MIERKCRSTTVQLTSINNKVKKNSSAVFNSCYMYV